MWVTLRLSLRASNELNRLPPSVVMETSVKVFKRYHDRHCVDRLYKPQRCMCASLFVCFCLWLFVDVYSHLKYLGCLRMPKSVQCWTLVSICHVMNAVVLRRYHLHKQTPIHPITYEVTWKCEYKTQPWHDSKTGSVGHHPCVPGWCKPLSRFGGHRFFEGSVLIPQRICYKYAGLNWEDRLH